MRRKSISRAAWICLSAPVAMFGQGEEPPVMLRSETRVVEIDVAVKDKAGNSIRDLRREDFTVFDNGKFRGIQFFSVGAEPGTGGPAAKPPAARLTAIVLDGLNTEFTDQSHARDEATRAINRMALDESVAILALAPGLKLQNFTRDRQRLLEAIEAFHPKIPPYNMRQRIQVTLAALKTMADRMRAAPGRKSIVWITGGFPWIRAYDRTIQNALNHIDDANVAIYPVDARGLTVGSGQSAFRIMDEFADATGGVAYYNRNDLSQAIEEAVGDSKLTYVMGFYLGDQDRDRRFHELKVAVDRPGAVVHSRRGYSPAAALLPRP